MHSYIVSSLTAAIAFANSLDYTQNGANWNYGLCQSGDQPTSKQSPIDLSSTTETRFDTIRAQVWDAPKDVKVNPEAIPYTMANYAAAADGSVYVDDPAWYWELFFPANITPVNHWAAQVVIDQNAVIQQYGITAVSHFHSPSEHTVDGKHYDLELHFGFAREDCFIYP